jgi:hypothetical protein
LPPFSARDTEARETPAACATSRMVTGLILETISRC